MKNVVVIFGGRAVEHEVSVITGIQVIENLNPKKYNVIPVFITKDGEMFTGESFKNFKNFKQDKFEDKRKCHFSTNYNDSNLYIENTGLFKKNEEIKIDVVLFAMHGTHGEDGALQGIFETNGIPFTGPSVLGSAVGMDKILMKDIYKANGIPVVKYYWFNRERYINKKDEVISEIESKLTYPLFVKPSNLGSSVGIDVAHNKDELIHAIEVAMTFDRKLIIEEAVKGARELNCACMGYNDNVETSSVEEAELKDEFLSFDQKYVNGGKSKLIGGCHNFIRDEEIVKKAKKIAKDAFIALDQRGNARVDILLDENGSMYVNEINTLPGSCAFYLWEDVGYTFGSLLDNMIEIALKASEEEKKTSYKLDLDLFNRTSFGSKL